MPVTQKKKTPTELDNQVYNLDESKRELAVFGTILTAVGGLINMQTKILDLR